MFVYNPYFYGKLCDPLQLECVENEEHLLREW